MNKETEFKKGEILTEDIYGVLYCSKCKQRKSVLYKYMNEYLCIDCINKIELDNDVYI